MADIIYLYPSFNNYDILIGESYNFLAHNNLKTVIVDDHSDKEELDKGLKLSKELDLKLLINKGKGIQSAIETVIAVVFFFPIIRVH